MSSDEEVQIVAPVDINYCIHCSYPVGYCKYSSLYKKYCRKWLKENNFPISDNEIEEQQEENDINQQQQPLKKEEE